MVQYKNLIDERGGADYENEENIFDIISSINIDRL